VTSGGNIDFWYPRTWGHFGGLGVDFGGPWRPLDTRGDVLGSDIVVTSVSYGFWVPMGSCWGVIFIFKIVCVKIQG